MRPWVIQLIFPDFDLINHKIEVDSMTYNVFQLKVSYNPMEFLWYVLIYYHEKVLNSFLQKLKMSKKSNVFLLELKVIFLTANEWIWLGNSYNSILSNLILPWELKTFSSSRRLSAIITLNTASASFTAPSPSGTSIRCKIVLLLHSWLSLRLVQIQTPTYTCSRL